MTSLSKRGLLGASICACLATTTGPAVAEPAVTKLEEIVVTATRREQKLQDVAEAISAISSRQISDLGLASLEDLSGQVPGLQYSSDRPGESFVTLRGLVPVSGNGSAVAIYIDEMLVNSTAGTQQDVRMFDLSRVEVIRGPGGTLYGESSLGGTLRYIMNKPDANAFAGKFETYVSDTEKGGSNYGVAGMANLPLVEGKLAMRVLGQYDNDGGWIDQPMLGAKDVNDSKNSSGRVMLRYTPDELTTIDLTAVYHKIDSGSPNKSDSHYQNASLVKEIRKDKAELYNLTVERDLGFGTLTATATRINRDMDPSFLDRSDVVPYFPLLGLPPVTEAWTNTARSEDSTVGEVRIASNNEGRFRWTAGVFYRDRKEHGVETAFSSPDIADLYQLTTSQSETNKAVFGEAYFDITDALELTLGGRWFTAERKASTSQYGIFLGVPQAYAIAGADKASEDVFTPKVRLAYRVNPDTLFYAQASQGFRGGGINEYSELINSPHGSSPVVGPGYDSERVWNYELGAKATFLDGRLTANTALFYMDWKDMQVALLYPPVTFVAAITNVGKAHVQGVEFELIAEPVDRLTLNAAITYLEAEIDDASNVAGALDSGLVKGTKLALVPTWKASANASYRWPVNDTFSGFVSGSVSYSDNTKSDVLNLNPFAIGSRINPAYTTASLTAGVERDKLGIYVYVDNLTNKFASYSVSTLPNLDFSEYLRSTNRPRTVGLRLSYDF